MPRSGQCHGEVAQGCGLGVGGQIGPEGSEREPVRFGLSEQLHGGGGAQQPEEPIKIRAGSPG